MRNEQLKCIEKCHSKCLRDFFTRFRFHCYLDNINYKNKTNICQVMNYILWVC